MMSCVFSHSECVEGCGDGIIVSVGDVKRPSRDNAGTKYYLCLYNSNPDVSIVSVRRLHFNND